MVRVLVVKGENGLPLGIGCGSNAFWEHGAILGCHFPLQGKASAAPPDQTNRSRSAIPHTFVQRVEQRPLSTGWPDVILQVRVDVSRTETCSYLFSQIAEFAADPGNKDVECHGSLSHVDLACRPGILRRNRVGRQLYAAAGTGCSTGPNLAFSISRVWPIMS